MIDDHIARHAASGGGRRWPSAKDPDAPVVLEVALAGQELLAAQGLFGRREFKAVQGVNFQLRQGHTLGVVGESGSGKTTMGLTLLRLHEPTAARSAR